MAMLGLYKRYIDLEGLCLTFCQHFSHLYWVQLEFCSGRASARSQLIWRLFVCREHVQMFLVYITQIPGRLNEAYSLPCDLKTINWTIYCIVEFADDFYFLEAVLVVFIYRVFSRQREREIQDGGLNKRWEYPLSRFCCSAGYFWITLCYSVFVLQK